ncbi:MAG: hypothetical protein HYV35_01835 [Lentisphaerae bacterium]|nr:hypothetical protein [Lentisphaerota bacterium]
MKTVLGLRCWTAFGFVFLLGFIPALSADPVVSNVRASQRAGTKLVDITYDVSATNNLTVSVAISTNSGLTYDLPASSFSGAGYGAGVTPGTDKAIVWDAGADFDGQYSTVMRVKVTADDGSQEVLPPDPESIASTPSNGVVSLIYDNVAFLFTGTNAIQTGVSPGAIDSLRVVVLRGRVLDDSSAAVSGVTVTVNSHSELGQTLTRTNGAYDIVVNGGGPVSMNFAKTGYLTIQRTLDLPWQDYVPVDDVMLKTADPNVMVATLPATNAQAVYGSVQTDTSGSRRAMVIIPANTRAYVFTEAGATQETSTLTTRLTEFTVGSNGPAAMPGDLPPTVAYTYALELAAEEAQVKIAGRDTLFSTNVFFYVDNFLEMPTGIQVPMAYYDDTTAAWIPSPDGRVVELAGTNASGLAELIVETNGVPADAATLAAMGFTDDERRLLVAQYGPIMTQTIWRVPIMQFSRHDPNYGTVPETGATPPNNPKPSTGDVNDPTDQGDYGRVQLENQVFQEALPIAGTPFRLHYSSGRVPGFQGQTSINIPLTGASFPAVLQRIHLKISIAGQNYTYYFAPSANLNYVFSWDGSDIYNRSLMGTMTATIRIGYQYQAYYALPTINYAASFGFPSGTRLPSDIIAPQPTILWQEHQVPLLTSSRSNGLGWWSLSEHHSYDPLGKTLHLGDGTDRDAEASSVLIISTIAGTGVEGGSGNGGPATNALVDPGFIAAAPNGDIYFYNYAAPSQNQIRRIAATNGYIYPAAGRPGGGAWDGEGGPATNARFNNVYGLTVGSDNSLYICDRGNRRVLRVDTNGIIRTVAGNGAAGYSGDGGPATNAAIQSPQDIAVAADGTMYISDIENHSIRRVGPDGMISTLAGNGSAGFSGDGAPATNATLNNPWAVKLGPDGALFVADYSNVRVRRIGPDGIITTVAGNGVSGFSGDGGLATNAAIQSPMDLAVGSDGTIYLAANSRIREITSDGIIRTIAGTGNTTAPTVNNYPATAVDFGNTTYRLTVAPDGTIYVADIARDIIQKISRNIPGVGLADILIASEDGNSFYQFDRQGRHLKTYHAWTGATLFEFGYTNGYLASVTDGDGNVTRITRDGSGTPQKITSPSPDNQDTILTLNANGFLSAVQNPAGETNQFGYTTNGLLTSVQGAKGASYTYTMNYNSTGQIVSASDPAGGSTTLRRSGITNGYEVSSTSALGRSTTARVEFLSTRDLRRATVLPDGTTQQQFEASNGMQSNRYPSGVMERWDERPDPRFGMQAPFRTGMVVRLSSGLAMTTTVSKTVMLTNQSWTSVAYLTNTLTVNGRVWKAAYSAANRQIQVASPLGRTYQIGLDSQGRRLWTQRPEMALVSNTFDGRGRLTGIQYGAGADARQFTLQYDANGYLGTVTDPLGRNLQFINDAIGRVTNMVRSDTQSVFFAYDAHGNRTALTPAGRSTHTFAFNTVDRLSSYSAPGATNSTGYAYNVDGQRLTVIRLDGQAISNVYNAAGQLINLSYYADNWSHGWSNGLVRQITAASGATINFGYNGFLITTVRWSGVITGQVAYAYNNDFLLRALTVNGTVITNGFDADGLLTNAGICRLQRSATNGLLTGVVLGTITQALTYNAFAELTNLVVNYPGGSNLFTETLFYDKAGRITSRREIVQDTTNTFNYSYDAVSRLTRVVTNNAGTNVYGYDLNGNRTNWLTSAGAFTATNDGQDRLIQWTGPATGQYAYSQAGDLTNRVVNTTNVTAYTYDALGNLRQAILPGGITNDYIIDGLGRRVAKRVNGVFTNGWLYANWLKPVAELDAGSNMVSVFVYGSRANAPDYMVKAGVTYRIVSDHLGSVRLVVREDTGDIAQRLDYDEWGRVLTNSAPGFQPFGFAGGLYDADTGLVRFGLRDYDPEVGRWTRKDPVLFGGGDPNLYAYCGNSPIRYVDVTGLGPNPDVGEQLSGLGQVMDAVGTVAPETGPAGTVVSGTTFLNTAATGTAETFPDMIHDTAMFITSAASLYIPVVGPIAMVVDYGSKAIFNAYLNPGEGTYSATSGPISSGNAQAAGESMSGSTTTSSGHTVYH